MSKKRKRRHNNSRKKNKSFSIGLERYIYKRIAGLPIKWEWVGAALALMVIVASIAGGYFKSSTLFGDGPDVIRMAADAGDYGTARKLLVSEWNGAIDSGVLGANVELEELAYPERKIVHEIERQRALLLKYPGSRDILLTLSRLYALINEHGTAREYWEMARVMDPNNPVFTTN